MWKHRDVDAWRCGSVKMWVDGDGSVKIWRHEGVLRYILYMSIFSYITEECSYIKLIHRVAFTIYYRESIIYSKRPRAHKIIRVTSEV
jgi:hypothetical protein